MFLPDPGKKIPKKKIAKKFKKLKNIIPTLYLSKPAPDRPRKEKKRIVPTSVPTRSGLENYQKDGKKNSKS